MHAMDKASFYKIQIYATGVVTIAIWSLLAWNYFHGGVPGHHLLADKDMPRISNGWGAIVLPLLTWFLLYRVQKRIFPPQVHHVEPNAIKSAIYAFIFSLAYAIILSTSFLFGYPDITSYLTLVIFVLALFFPVYRAEYLLGYVLGLSVTFGAVIPTVAGSIITLISFLLFRFIRSAALYVVSRLR